MKHKYSFIQEGPWQYAVGNAITSAAGSNAFRGASLGAGVGAIGNMARNYMKRDDDPTKTGVFKSALKGAGAGAAAGAITGSVVGHLARNGSIRNLQNQLMTGGDKAFTSKLQSSYYQKLINSGMNPDNALAEIERLTNSGVFNANRFYRFGNVNRGTFSKIGNSNYLTREAL